MKYIWSYFILTSYFVYHRCEISQASCNRLITGMKIARKSSLTWGTRMQPLPPTRIPSKSSVTWGTRRQPLPPTRIPSKSSVTWGTRRQLLPPPPPHCVSRCRRRSQSMVWQLNVSVAKWMRIILIMSVLPSEWG